MPTSSSPASRPSASSSDGDAARSVVLGRREGLVEAAERPAPPELLERQRVELWLELSLLRELGAASHRARDLVVADQAERLARGRHVDSIDLAVKAESVKRQRRPIGPLLLAEARLEQLGIGDERGVARGLPLEKPVDQSHHPSARGDGGGIVAAQPVDVGQLGD